MGPGPADDWNDLSTWWVDEFTGDRDREYAEQIIPMVVERTPASGLVVDVGCGEGQVARAVADSGPQVLALDRAEAQLRAAGHDTGMICADAVHVPVRTDAADGAFCVLVLEHLDDIDTAIAELARVVRPGATVVVVLNHPLLQTPGSGWVDDHMLDPPEYYWRVGPYLVEESSVERVGVHGGDRSGEPVLVRFRHRPLSRYVNRAAAVGLRIEEMVEPAPPAGYVDESVAGELGDTMPRLMLLRFTYDGAPAAAGGAP